MGQPTFIQKIDGSSAAANNLTLTPGTATVAGDMLLVGIALNATGTQSPQQVAGIVDSAGTPIVGGQSTGVPVNTWAFLGSSNGITIAWWVCKTAASITWLTINITGSGPLDQNAIVATMLEYSGANGVSFPNFQALEASENTIQSQYLLETAAAIPNSGAELMIGMFAMLSDTFNASPPTPGAAPQTVRTTDTLNIPPSFSWQIIEQATTAPVGSFTSGGEQVTLAVGALNITAESATELATPNNVAGSSMQCLYLLISGGLILNTPPGFSDQPDSALAAGKVALGTQIAKINGNAALGMCRMEIFSGLFSDGQNASGPWVSPVDGYTYQANELTYIWGIYSTANPSNNWLTGPTALWYCGWNVDQETGDVSCIEWYASDSAVGSSNDGILQVFIIAQRQQTNLKVATTPTWTQQQASSFVTDVPYAQDVLSEMNDNSKFAVIGQECIYMGAHFHGDTVPRPVSPADDYEYSYSEVKFVFSWMFTTQNFGSDDTELTPMPHEFDGGGMFSNWLGGVNLSTLYASISSAGVVTCEVGMSSLASGSPIEWMEFTSLGMLAVFAFCQRSRSGAPSSVANKFAEISNALFYPGEDLPAGLGAQIVNNINEASLTPEFFGPTLYQLGQTIPTPVSPIDGYVYQRSELTYIWEWAEMTETSSWPPSSSDYLRTALFSCQIDAATGVITNTVTSVGSKYVYTSVIWRASAGGPYDAYTNTGWISVVVVACRNAQQTEITQSQVTPQSDYGSVILDQLAPGAITVNGT